MGAKKIDLAQGSKEWLDFRYDFVTASQIPILFLLSRFETPLGLFEEKIMRQEMRSNEGKEILFERGHNAEKRAREWLKEKGFSYEQAVMVNEKHPDLMASLDGISPDGSRILECKFVGKEVLKSIRLGSIPPEHLCQIQAALLVSEAKTCDYFATAPDGDSHWLEITPDEAYQSEIAIMAKKFMENVRAGKPPEACDRDIIFVEDARFQKIEELDRAIKALTEEMDSIKDALANDFQGRRIECGKVQLIRSVRRGNIDYAKVPVLKGVDLEKYRKPSSEVVTFKIKRGEK